MNKKDIIESLIQKGFLRKNRCFICTQNLYQHKQRPCSNITNKANAADAKKRTAG